MIESIRKYVDYCVKQVDDLGAYRDDVFANNTVEAFEGNKSYNLSVGSTTTSVEDTDVLDEISCSLDIFSIDFRDTYADFERLYCKAFNIRDQLLTRVNLVNAGIDINMNIEPVSIEPFEDVTNDKSFKIRIQFTVRAYAQLN